MGGPDVVPFRSGESVIVWRERQGAGAGDFFGDGPDLSVGVLATDAQQVERLYLGQLVAGHQYTDSDADPATGFESLLEIFRALAVGVRGDQGRGVGRQQQPHL